MELYFKEIREWKLVNSNQPDFKKLLKERNIVISDSAKIGDSVKLFGNTKIGDSVTIGDNITIGYNVIIGANTKIGANTTIEHFVTIGHNTEIGCSVTIGNYTEIGDNVKIGHNAKIGDNVEIGDFAEIGLYAKIIDSINIKAKFNVNKSDIFSPLNIAIMTGVIMNNGEGIFYKSVKPDLTCFYEDENYQYKIGKGDKKTLKRNQDSICGEGWHWTSYERAVVFANKRPHKIISAKIKLDDILSVYDKIRVRKFSDVKLVEL